MVAIIKGGYGLPSQAVVNPAVSGTFTATGQSNQVRSRGVDVSISGTFAATVNIERYIGSGWQVIEQVTSPTERYIENDKSRPIRLNCAAYTSGTVTYALEG